ncbi:uncharacterized protein LOC122503290 [Leptopilina heterotoma]|uniref:uncharacterized protein LOC122503290 n=1 Tax=Leptopilina heterotoma TaxID=63436 RepID=UPI001CA9122A|nr:uncharacterized protein LOC122503290 [Leptopilina heterotoma]
MLIAKPPTIPKEKIKETTKEYDPEEFSQLEEIYEDAIDSILSRLPEPVPNQPNPNGEDIVSSSPNSASRSTSAVQLPRITLPTFSGNYSEWLAFRDLFYSLVIENNSISDVERLHYLKLSLRDEALIFAQNQPGTSANFQIIWKNLESRYNNCKALINEYLKKIVEIPDITSDWLNSLKNMRNVIITVTTALTNLKRPIDEKNDLSVFLLINKLDKFSRDQWELVSSDSTDPPSLDQFIKFLDARIRALEASVNPKKRTENKITNVPQSTVSSCAKIHSHQSLSKLPHHSFLHREQTSLTADIDSKNMEANKRSVNNTTLNKSETETSILSHFNASNENRTAVLLATARVIVEASDGRRVQIRALLDQGSDATFISDSVCQLLRLPRKNSNIAVSGLGGNCSNKVSHSVPIIIKGVNSNTDSFMTRAFVLPKITSYVPTEFVLSNIPDNLRDLELADPCLWSTERIDLLIGSDLYSRVLLDGICTASSGYLVAQSTSLGWILSGPISNPSAQAFHINVHLCVDDHIEKSLNRFWELEEVPSINKLTESEQKCEDYFLKTFSRLPDGHYMVDLLFIKSPSQLGDSYHTALNSLKRLEKKFSSDPQLASQYKEFMAKYESLGHMTCMGPVNDSNSENVFIPHHPVCRDSSQTTKERGVFNASSFTSTQVSLNDCLHAGPKLQNSITTILLNWRQHKFVLCADMANMFREILISPEYRKYQYILWRESIHIPIQAYALNTVTYGMKSYLYLAIRVLRQLVHDEQSRFPNAAPVLLNDTYVDDVYLGGPDKSSTLQLRDEIIQLTRSGGFTGCLLKI